jgi:hypothetical protein
MRPRQSQKAAQPPDPGAQPTVAASQPSMPRGPADIRVSLSGNIVLRDPSKPGVSRLAPPSVRKAARGHCIFAEPRSLPPNWQSQQRVEPSPCASSAFGHQASDPLHRPRRRPSSAGAVGPPAAAFLRVPLGDGPRSCYGRRALRVAATGERSPRPRRTDRR